MRRLVLDASIALCWALADEDNEVAAKALAFVQTGPVLVPTLWWFEIRNALIMNERRQRLTEADTAAFLRELGRLPIVVDNAPDETAVLSLSRRHRLSIYDAAYLDLAARASAALATLDADLIRAAQAERVPLAG